MDSSEKNCVSVTRRKLMLALASTPLALELATRSSAAQAANALPAAAVIEGVQNWLYPGWESLSSDDLPASLNNLDLIKQASAKLAQKIFAV